jgi:hypothetical protein
VKFIFYVYIWLLSDTFFSAGVFVKETDAAKFAICTIEDPRTLNKTLYLRPPGSVCSMNELVDLWEAKISKCLKKTYITEEQLLKGIHGKQKFSGTALCTCTI